MRIVFLISLIALVSACSSARLSPRTTSAPVAAIPFASGPIQQACLAADRKAASPRLCGCIQAVANQQLSGGQQSKAVTFFNDPHQAQVARQNGSRSFWNSYKAYAESAERVCSGA